MLRWHLLPFLGFRAFISLYVRSLITMWRVKYFLREATERSDEITELTKMVGPHFYNASQLVSKATWHIYKRIGHDHEQSYEGQLSICWEAPIGILIYIAGRPALGMGLELHGDTLTICQLQGARDLRIPRMLQDWPRLFVEGCMMHALNTTTVRQVRIPCANRLLYYHTPIMSSLEEQDDEKARRAYQRRMRRRYDGTARQLGFKKRAHYYVWENPNYAQP